MIRKYIMKELLLIVSVLLGFFSIAYSEEFAIVAVVNDSIITSHDVANRTRLLFLDSGLEINAENSEKLGKVGRDQLIDEALQLQQMQLLNASVAASTLDSFIRDLERNNNLEAGRFRIIFAERNIDYSHFRDQQYTRLAWNSYLQRQFQTSGGVSDAEVASYISGVEARQGELEVRFRQIFLPYRSSLLIGRTRALGDDILFQLASGADFGALASSFSASHAVNKGGDSGWVPLNFLDIRIKNEVLSLEVGEVSGLIDSATGILIIKLEGKRALGVEAAAEIQDPQKVRAKLVTQKLELLHRQTMRRLKTDAFIELR